MPKHRVQITNVSKSLNTLTTISAADVRYGFRSRNVRFNPKRGNAQHPHQRPLSANRRLGERQTPD
jgi:hypothetical protein